MAGIDIDDGTPKPVEVGLRDPEAENVIPQAVVKAVEDLAADSARTVLRAGAVVAVGGAVVMGSGNATQERSLPVVHTNAGTGGGEPGCTVDLAPDGRESVEGTCAVQVSDKGEVVFNLRLDSARALIAPGNFEVELLDGGARAIKNRLAPVIVARRYTSNDGTPVTGGTENPSRMQGVVANLAEIGTVWRNGDKVTIQNEEGGVLVETEIQEPSATGATVIDSKSLPEDGDWDEFDLSQIGVDPSTVRGGCNIRIRGGNSPEDRKAIALMIAAMLAAGAIRRRE